MDNLNIVRCDDTMWSCKLADHASSFQEIRVIASDCTNGSQAFQLAASVIKFLYENLRQESTYYKLEFKKQTPIQGSWLVENITESWYIEQLKNSLAAFSTASIKDGRLPFVTVPTPTGVIKTVAIWKVISASWGAALTRLPSPSHLALATRNALESYATADKYTSPAPTLPSIAISNTDEAIADLLDKGCFMDPFTVLASDALQKQETHFVSENDIQGDFAFILKNGFLSLVPFKDNKDAITQEMRAATQLYVKYVNKVYGHTVINCARLNLALSLRGLEAVKPDHVFKFNMASQFVLNMLHINNFLKNLKTQDNTILQLGSWKEFYTSFWKSGVELPLKPLRGLYAHIKQKVPSSTQTITFLELGKTFKDDGSRVERVKDLSLESCDNLLKMVLYGFNLDDALGNHTFFTGRRIDHLAICGYKTMGNTKEYDPTRNWFEALHTYPLLSQGEWGDVEGEHSFYELLVHVLVKKSLLDVDPTAAQKRCTGRFIPAPMLNKTRTWYSITAFVNDGGGDLNYILRPVSREAKLNEKMLPFIKLFRSTASDAEAESHRDSINADLRVAGIGSLDENGGDAYEEKDFFRCTLPLWMGYLLLKDTKNAKKAFDAYPLKADFLNGKFPTWEEESSIGQEDEIVDCLTRLSTDQDKAKAQATWDEFKTLIGENSLKLLLELSGNRDEWMPELKEIKQDVVFVGHSLGGALAQQSKVHFLVDKGRIPLPGCSYKCICFDSPGTTLEKSKAFTQFTNDNADLFQQLKLGIELSFYFEKKDTVAEGGEIFLGTTKEDINSRKKNDLFKFHAEVRAMNPGATVKELTTLPIHGKRFAYIAAIHGEKPAYKKNETTTTEVSAETLYRLKREWKPSSTDMDPLGWNTPSWIVEGGRKVAGGGNAAYSWIKNKVFGAPKEPSEDVTRVQGFVEPT